MARSKNLLKVEGSLGELSYYKSVFGEIVRRKGGPSKELIKTSSKMVRVREQITEFGESAKAAKLFRQALNLKSRGAWELSITWRGNQLMNSVAKTDSSSVRGKRIVDKGFATSAGKALVTDFNIMENASLTTILATPILVKPGSRTITINQLVPSRDINYPKGASHVRITGGYSRIDFSKGIYELIESAEVVLSLKSKTSTNQLLKMKSATLATGYDFYFVHLEFSQQINSTFYDLGDKKYNCMSVLQVV